jgi:hypothetical protein
MTQPPDVETTKVFNAKVTARELLGAERREIIPKLIFELNKIGSR